MILEFFAWWYGKGWTLQYKRVQNRVAGLFDMFSFDLLAKTLFSPYRQISAGNVNGPLGVQLRAFVDKMVSRSIGAMIRTVVLFVGFIAIIFGFLFGMVQMAVWPFIPFLPFVGLLLALMEFLPWR